ncbi:LppU/SCO3897 family protein [Saccharothrix sp. NRRL B-16314]|uniref:LppU/SCO3897 family protein n=1 Tax=Saccharothrix sp. NRRL B-16314 TaxID=1463825 RepID=UPI0005274EB3|nr:hypothetical protein [Saccharothrix sp. NRRL B-16314]
MNDESSRSTGDASPSRFRPGGTAMKVLVGVLAVVVIAAVAYGVRYLTTDAASAEAGDCVGVAAEADGRADVSTLDCDADEASFKVGKVLEAADDPCPEEGVYTEIVPNGPVGDGYKLCLIPNMAEGACYGPAEGSGFDRIDCSGPETVKVTKVIRGSTDTTACPSGSGMAYPEPAVTYCLAPADS